jgi:ABC-type uncharacterized transport system substrate-binding protein
MRRWLYRVKIVLFVHLLLFATDSWADTRPFKILVVMSYEQENPWCHGIREGIDSVLSSLGEISYFYLDTKIDFEGGRRKAEEAYALYERLKPDGVIVADDDAQAMFVVPYLKGKEKTPVMFCGINEDPQVYGYPTEHISGVLERGHVRESLAFVQQLQPSVHTACFLVKESPAGRALFKQVESERESYPAEVAGLFAVKTLQDLEALGGQFEEKCQALYVDSLEGILGAKQEPLSNRGVFETLLKVFKGPVIGANMYHVEEGALCAVVKTGQEQGELAAEQLLKALRGTPVQQIPITVNYRGRRLINVDTMAAMGISLRPITLKGATLVKTK